MNKKPHYIIPAGTLVQTRNVVAELQLRPHVTRKELRFLDRANTGDGGFLYYFQHGDWLISVDSTLVQFSQAEGDETSSQGVSPEGQAA